MASKSTNVAEALDVIQCEIASYFYGPRVPLSNTIGYKATLLPSIVFLTGMRRPSIEKLVTTVGIGYINNYLNGESHRVFGLLQRSGVAGLLVRLNGDSFVGPALGMAIWHLVSVYGAKDPDHPFTQPSTTGQTWLDKKVVGPSRMLKPEYDPDGILTTIMTSASMWFGRWCSTNAMHSVNERSVLGLSMVSLGYMSCYAFPQKYPFSQTFWTFSYALGTSGFSLLKWTAVDLACGALSHYDYGAQAIGVLNIIGSHAIEVYMVNTLLDASGFTHKVRELAKGWKGIAFALAVKNVILYTSALVLDQLL